MIQQRLQSWLLLPLLGVLAASSCLAANPSDPLTPRAHFMSGKLYLGQKLYERAEEQVRLAVEGDSLSATYRAYWAIALCEVAKERFKNSAGRDLPGRIEVLRTLEPLYRRARDEFQRAAGLDPEEMRSFCEDNRVHYWVDAFKQAEGMFRNRNYEEANELLQLLVVLDPTEPQGFLTMAYCLDGLNRSHEAVERAQTAVQLALQKIAEANCDSLRTKKARLDCSRRRDQHQLIVNSVDNFLRSRNLVLGNQAFDASMTAEGAEERRRHLGDAMLYFEKSLALDPGLQVVRFRLGNTYYALAETYEDEGDTTRAYPYFRQAADVFLSLMDADSLSDGMRSDALYNGKNALYAVSAWEELLPWLKLTVDLDPRDSGAYRRVAECLAELKRSDEAVSYLMMFNSLAENGVAVDAAEAAAAARGAVEATGESAAIGELGDPEEVRSYREIDSGRTIRTWIWWRRGEVRHFVNGRHVGGITITPPG